MTAEFKPGTFPNPLRVEDSNGVRDFVLIEPFRYQYCTGRPVRVTEVWVPPLTVWDGASIPRFFWRVFGSPFVGRHRKPSVIHDFLWTEAKAGRETYQRANWAFWHGLRSQGVGPVKSWLMWLAVAFSAGLQGRAK